MVIQVYLELWKPARNGRILYKKMDLCKVFVDLVNIAWSKLTREATPLGSGFGRKVIG